MIATLIGREVLVVDCHLGPLASESSSSCTSPPWAEEYNCKKLLCSHSLRMLTLYNYLTTSHIFENLDKGSFSFTDFFGRRVRRIFPALIIVMTCSLAFGYFALLADEFAQLGKHVASGAAFITNFILVDESGYFDNAAETKPMLHLWSLVFKLQMLNLNKARKKLVVV